LKTIMTGSVGLVTISFPPAPVRYGAIGCLRRLTIWKCWTSQRPSAKPTTMAASERRMRQRSSSRWSRKGISPGDPVMRPAGARA
jgi:hypothetical protein